MITFAYPWLLILLPLPLVVARLLTEHQQARSSVRIPSIEQLARILGRQPSPGAVVLRRSTLQWVVLAIAWTCSLIAVARPQLVGEPITKTVASRDLLLAVDLSGSMDATDFTDRDGNQVDRLTAVKQVLDDFLTRRQGDRVGLIFFGSAAFLQAPFTEDLELCRSLLDEAQVRMAGPQTVIGDAVGLALTVFKRSEQQERVLIVLTDGNDTGSKVPPERAAAIARDEGVTIHTIAVGDPSSVGEEKIDEEVLKGMASRTGGSFFRADDREQLEQIYERLDDLDTRELESLSYRPKTDLFAFPLAAFLLIGFAYHGISSFRWRRHHHNSSPALPSVIALLAILFAGAANVSSEPTGFHFLRPAWLLAILPAALIIVAILKREDASTAWRGVIDDHLLKHLLVKPESRGKLRPVHLLAVVWCLAVLALAGPTWRREPSPFADDEAVVVFALEVSPTMLAQDVQPSRLQRSVHKIRDLLELRKGDGAALIAYAGTAHLVMPITSDTEIIGSFAAELAPDVMPKPGDATADAVALANQQLTGSGLPGSIVVITDGIDASQDAALSAIKGAPIHILAIAGDQTKPLPLGSPPAPAIDRTALQQSASAAGGTLTVVTSDDSDVRTLSREITSRFIAAQSSEGSERWMDMGYWLTPCVALLALIWFRPGWVVKWD